MYERSDPIHVLKAAPDTVGQGIFVFGAPRGGTSMVAGALRILGVDMGNRQGHGNNEDLDVQDARGDVGPLGDHTSQGFRGALERIRPVINRRAECEAAWGWKDPHGVLYANHVQDLLPAPRLLCIFRDPQAAAERVHMLTGQSFLVSLEQTLSLYQRCQAFLDAIDQPISTISYEKSLVRPERFVEQLIAFCGLSPTEAQIDEAISFCYPERGHGSPTDPGWPRQGAL